MRRDGGYCRRIAGGGECRKGPGFRLGAGGWSVGVGEGNGLNGQGFPTGERSDQAFA